MAPTRHQIWTNNAANPTLFSTRGREAQREQFRWTALRWSPARTRDRRGNGGRIGQAGALRFCMPERR